MYWFIFAMLRFVLRRELGSVGVADILLLVLIADAAQNGMAGEYTTITEGAILVATIIGWSWIIDGASYRWPAARRFFEPDSVVLIRNGRLIHQHLAREWISVEELTAKLREHGLERPAQVKMARLEGDGQISVVPYDCSQPPRQPPSHRSGDLSRPS